MAGGGATFEIADIKVGAGARDFTWIPVTNTLFGQPLALALHVINGARPGPTLGIISSVHGTEYTPIPILREVLQRLDPKDLSGTILIIPVGNPISFYLRSRKTSLEWDYNFQDMNRSFPGWIETSHDGAKNPPSNHNMTQMLALAVTKNLIEKSDYFLDYHSCGMLGRFVYEVPMQAGLPADLRAKTLELSRALNLGVIHEYGQGTTTATGYASNVRGIPAACGEFGGVMMSIAIDDHTTKLGVDSTLNVLRHLNMVPGKPVFRPKQLLYKYQSQVRPTKSGYLLSKYDADALAYEFPPGVEVKEGDVLGTVFDPYTFKELETIRAAADGLLIIPMRHGPVWAGDLGYIVAEHRNSEYV